MPNPVEIGKWGLSAREYYSSGSYHGAYDIPCPTGTIIKSIAPGVVLGYNRGVPPNKPGHNPGSGAPSNWILIWTPPIPGFPEGFTTYYQHCLEISESVRKVGAKVRAGQNIAASDNTGNSTGPHLHFHVMYGKQYDPYAMYRDRSLAVYPPTLAVEAWDRHAKQSATPRPRPVIHVGRLYAAITAGRPHPAVPILRRALQIRWLANNPHWGPVPRARLRQFQKRHRLPATGLPDRKTLRLLANMTKVFDIE